MISIDLSYLVDRLEAAINKGFVIPFTANRLINEDDCLDIIEQMRMAIPEEIRQARRVTQDRERILAQAKEEGDRIIALAHEEAGRLTDMHEVARAAQDRALVIQRQAEADAQATRNGADEYAQQVLLELQQRFDELTARLATLQATVNNGLTILSEKHTAVKAAPPPPPPPRPKEPVSS
jgi:cell division septum initiation protein DivIVA